MMKLKGFMQNWINKTLLLAGLVLVVACGGGSGPGPDDGAVRLGLSLPDGSVIQAEMYKDLASEFANFTVSVSSTFENTSNQVGTVTIESYTMTFTRNDSGPTIGPYTRDVGGIRISASQPDLPISATFQAIILSTEDKLFSDFGLEFNRSYAPVVFDVRMEINGRSDAGQNLSVNTTFQLEAATYEPYDQLVPSVESFPQTESLTVGDSYLASWRTSGRVDYGLMTMPWGDQFVLSSNSFPFGSISADTSFLAGSIAPGQTANFNTGLLYVANPFGTAEGSGQEVSISELPVDPPPNLVINEFFANPTTVTAGSPTTLTWVVSGAPTQLSLLPNTYSDEVVSFAGKDLTFDSLSITPDISVRPILEASRGNEAITTAFLDTAITVVPIQDQGPPQLVFFVPSRSQISVNKQVVFHWEILGNVEKLELFPFNGQRVDVTGTNQLLGPPMQEVGSFTFSLLIYGADGSVTKADTVVTVVPDDNIPISVSVLSVEPGNSIQNGDTGSFSFRIMDPERADSSYRIRKIAGDSASFFPKEGTIYGGSGDATVSFMDFTDNSNGYLVFEISAYDDVIFGSSRDSTRAVALVTITTNGTLPDDAPVISGLEFVDAGTGDLPGTEGQINFTISDPDTRRLDWRISIVSGDAGGSLEPSSGEFDVFGGDVSVSYVDDPDTPTDPVVFLIRVDEDEGANRQYTLQTLRVEKGVEGEPGGTPSENQPIGFPFIGLYANSTGMVEAANAIGNSTLYYNGTPADARLFRFSDLSGELTAISMVFDMNHESTDPAQVVEAPFARTFLPSGNDANLGNLTFVGFYASPGLEGAPSQNTIANGVARWKMTFNVETFMSGPGVYNLPTTNSRDYFTTITPVDSEGNTEQVTKKITVAVP